MVSLLSLLLILVVVVVVVVILLLSYTDYQIVKIFLCVRTCVCPRYKGMTINTVPRYQNCDQRVLNTLYKDIPQIYTVLSRYLVVNCRMIKYDNSSNKGESNTRSNVGLPLVQVNWLSN